MKKKKRGKVLEELFDELENHELSDLEQDQQLKGIGINPEELVQKSLEKLNKFLKKEPKSIHVIKLNEPKKHLLAAKKRKTNLDNLKNKLDNMDNKKNK